MRGLDREAAAHGASLRGRIDNAHPLKASMSRTTRCGACVGCIAQDCGRCMNCLDKRCNGGRGIKKQACVMRVCSNLQAGRPPNTPDGQPPGHTEAEGVVTDLDEEVRTRDAWAHDVAAGDSSFGAPGSAAGTPQVDSALHDVLESLFMLNKQRSSSDTRPASPQARRTLVPTASSETNVPRVRETALGAAKEADRRATGPVRHDGAPLARHPGSGAPKSLRCGSCAGCIAQDCGACKNCLDKPKYGGPGVKKQACLSRKCLRPLPPPQAGAGSTSVDAHASDARDPAPSSQPTPPADRAQVSGPLPPPLHPTHPTRSHTHGPGGASVEGRARALARDDGDRVESDSTAVSVHASPPGGGGRTLLRLHADSDEDDADPGSALLGGGGRRRPSPFGFEPGDDGQDLPAPSSLTILSFVTAQAAAEAAMRFDASPRTPVAPASDVPGTNSNPRRRGEHRSHQGALAAGTAGPLPPSPPMGVVHQHRRGASGERSPVDDEPPRRSGRQSPLGVPGCVQGMLPAASPAGMPAQTSPRGQGEQRATVRAPASRRAVSPTASEARSKSPVLQRQLGSALSARAHAVTPMDTPALQRLARRPASLAKVGRRAERNPGYDASLVVEESGESRVGPLTEASPMPPGRPPKRPRADESCSPLGRSLRRMMGRAESHAVAQPTVDAGQR
mmetsp:Transcript_26836/g.72378  ORF Transcript_26836/g.72378 Transcript_26836/m.72378 type:complete len:678 (-) Transcript_26836:416-2449(-)